MITIITVTMVTITIITIIIITIIVILTWYSIVKICPSAAMRTPGRHCSCSRW